MLKKQTYFTVGLFVLIGIAVGVAAIVWVSTTKYFKKGTTFVTYFDESVQGLQVDSVVKYRGVDVGRVEKIAVAPDYRLIEVVMKIDFKGDVLRETVAKLQMAGITGLVFVDLDRRKPGDPTPTPKITFPSEYPVVPSYPSDIQQISSGVNEIVGKMKKIDLQAISDQVLNTTKALGDIAGGPTTKRILQNMEAVTARLASASEKVDKIMKGGSVEGVILEAQAAIKDARAIMAKVKTEVDSINVVETAQKTNMLIDNASKRTQAVAIEAQITLENLRIASETLTILLEKLKADPSALIFSSPPAPGRAK